MVEKKLPSHDDLQRGKYKDQYDALIWLDHDIKLVEDFDRQQELTRLSVQAREALARDDVDAYEEIMKDLPAMVNRSRKIK